MTEGARRAVIAVMWICAIGAMIAIYLAIEPAVDPRARSDAPAVEHDAEDSPSGERRGARDMAPIPVGAPREYRGDRRHTGRSPYRGPAAADRAWTFHTAGNIAGQAVVGDDGTVYFGALDHFVYALAPDGTERWRHELGGPVYSTPALDGAGHVFVGSDADRLYCLDAASGELVWYLRTEGDVDTGIAIAPDGWLAFGSGEYVYSVTPEGEVRWRFRARVRVFSAPAIDDDGTVYFGAQDDHVYAIAPDGSLRWRYHVPDDVDSAVVIGDDGTLYFGGDDRHVRALSRDGEELWRHDVDGYVRAPVALGSAGDLLVPVFGPHPRLVSLDRASGEERWNFPIGGAGASSDLGVGSSPTIDVDGNVYFGADDGYVYSLSSDGQMRWVLLTADRVDSDPILAPDGTLYVGSDDDYLYAVR